MKKDGSNYAGHTVAMIATTMVMSEVECEHEYRYEDEHDDDVAVLMVILLLVMVMIDRLRLLRLAVEAEAQRSDAQRRAQSVGALGTFFVSVGFAGSVRGFQKSVMRRLVRVWLYKP